VALTMMMTRIVKLWTPSSRQGSGNGREALGVGLAGCDDLVSRCQCQSIVQGICEGVAMDDREKEGGGHREEHHSSTRTKCVRKCLLPGPRRRVDNLKYSQAQATESFPHNRHSLGLMRALFTLAPGVDSDGHASLSVSTGTTELHSATG
jgi:hypothetical protein